MGFLPLSDDCGLLFSSSFFSSLPSPSFLLFFLLFFSGRFECFVTGSDVSHSSRTVVRDDTGPGSGPAPSASSSPALSAPGPAPSAPRLPSVSSRSSFIRAEWPLRQSSFFYLSVFGCSRGLSEGQLEESPSNRTQTLTFHPERCIFPRSRSSNAAEPLCLHIYLLFLKKCTPFNVNILQKDLYVY